MELQWAENEKLEEILERKKDETMRFAGGGHARSTLELVVHARMSQGKGVKCTQRKEESERMFY